MAFELDHLFVCASRGAPEGDELVRFGLHEGLANRHEGQGTANRRFPFLNAMIELLWIEDANEAQSDAVRRTKLWERWRNDDGRSCPFGICVRPSGESTDEVPFPSWAYRPSYLPSPLAFNLGEAGVREPMWIYLGFMRRSAREKHFTEHPIGVREITGLELTTPAPFESAAGRAVLERGILTVRPGASFSLEVEFDHGRRGQAHDFAPQLPLVFRY